MRENLPITELFGPTLQGEGPDLGRPCAFIRVFGCPVQCPGCDTNYSWGANDNVSFASADDLLSWARKLQAEHLLGLVVSGGEPLTYYDHSALRAVLHSDWCWTAIETSGFTSRPIDPVRLGSFLSEFTTVVLSPKITPSLHGGLDRLTLERVVDHFSLLGGSVVLKFVVQTEEDVKAILAFKVRHPWTEGVPTYVMPYGIEPAQLLAAIPWLLPYASRYGWIVTPRLHAMVWPHRRGV